MKERERERERKREKDTLNFTEGLNKGCLREKPNCKKAVFRGKADLKCTECLGPSFGRLHSDRVATAFSSITPMTKYKNRFVVNACLTLLQAGRD